MARLEDIVPGANVDEIDPNGPVEIVSTTWYGNETLEEVYRDSHGRPQDRMLYRHDEPLLRAHEGHRRWGFDADAALTRLAAEAQRIRLAYNFDPPLAIHSSEVDPLPHQITAVYESMLPRQPLRFLLADDPGAGKTIMTGLFMKELYLRGDLDRCLIVCPGSLAVAGRAEPEFDIPFEIYTNDRAEASRTGNWFAEQGLVETIMHLLCKDGDRSASSLDSTIGRARFESVIRTGMLPQWIPESGGRAVDTSALGAVKDVQTTRPQPTRHDINTDRMRLVRSVIAAPAGGNAVSINGEPVSPDDFVDDIEAGLREMYEHLPFAAVTPG